MLSKMTPERRAELAERFASGDPVVLAAVKLRKAEEKGMRLYHAQSLTDPSLVFYNLMHLKPSLEAIDTYMCNLTSRYQLQLGDELDREIVDQLDLYDPERYRFDLRQGQVKPRIGEVVHITRSAIYELSGKRLQPIFEATVRPLRKL